MKHIALLSILLLCGANWTYGQDSTRLQRSTWSGQWRTTYHTTINKKELKDFHSLGTGGYLKYTYKPVEQLQIGAAFYGTVNLGIQDLTELDAATGRGSRYETGFFDVQDPADHFIGYPGELLISYAAAGHAITLGRMKLKSPFINPQDGRMIPTLIEGARYEYKSKTINAGLGWINRIAPRSTAGFFNIGDAIGLYPVGRNQAGAPSLYAGNTESNFILTGNVDFAFAKTGRVRIWNYLMDNVSNTVHTHISYPLSERTKLAVEWLHQDRVGNGGNAVDSLRYFESKRSDLFGVQLNQKIGKSTIIFSYNRIFEGGQFLFPREFGREAVFSFQKRERSEGTADSHALVIYYQNNFNSGSNTFRTILSAGHHWRPDVSRPAANKYAVPDYAHLNVDVFWNRTTWKHLRPELLITYKKGTGTYPDNPNLIFNKVDLWLINAIINYNF